MQLKFLFAAMTIIRLQGQAAPVSSSPKYLITFGDSYSQTGFDINGEAPSEANPIGNPAFPGWTASGGISWIGSLVAEVNTSLTLSYNLAYGGATVDADIIAPYTPTVVCMDDQVETLLSFISNKGGDVPWTASNALVGVWMGVNDVGNSFWYENSHELLERTVARYFGLLQKLYDAGFRKFALLTVPPTNLTPLMLQQGADSNALLVAAIKTFNELLVEGFNTFASANTDIVGAVIDTSAAFNRAIENPSEYGAPNPTCYNSDGVSCLWFNDYHPGIAIERLVAADVERVVSGQEWGW